MADGLPPILEFAIAFPSPDLARAVATLRRGTRFLGAGPATGMLPGNSKVLGNGLREMDRFLSILIDAVAEGLALDAGDRVALRRQHNTARKLATIRAAMALASPDDAALRAIGRSRNCLFHTAGIVRAGGPRSVPTQGWTYPDGRPANPPAPRLAPGSRLAVSAGDLHRIGLFYDRIADDLVAAFDRKTALD